MTTIRYLMLLCKAAILLAWTATAATAAVVVARNPSQVELDLLVVVLSSVISTLSGGTALAVRINALLMAQDPEKPRPFVRPWLFAFAHMGGSWTAGVMAFLVARGSEWNVWYLLLGVLLMSFLGARAVEALAERWLAVMPLPGDVRPKEG